MNPFLFYGIMLIVFVLLAVGFYLLLKSVMVGEKIREHMGKMYANLSARDEKRIRSLENERRKYGNVSGKKNFVEKAFERLDSWLVYSGWSVQYTWLNTSTYIVINVVGSALIFLVTFLLTYNFILSFLLVFSAILIPLFCMMRICDTKYKAVEGQLLFAVNTIANASAGSDDLVKVLDDSSPYMGEPLRSSVQRAVATAGLTGNAVDCVNRLTREIEHPLFVRFIRNLEICSRVDADYKAVARDYAPQVEKYVRAAERKRAIFANGRMSILTLLVLGVVLIYLSCDSLGEGFSKTLMNMTQNAFGILVLVVESMIYISALLYMIFGMRR